VAHRALLETRAFVALLRARAFGIEAPRRLVAIAAALRDFGPFGGGLKVAAVRHGERPAIADERGVISFADLDEQVNRLANALRRRGLCAGSNLGILCRNHRFALVAMYAASRAGMNTIPLNTAFSPRQAAEVCARERIELLIYDADLADVVADVAPVYGRVAVAIEDSDDDALGRLLATGEPVMPLQRVLALDDDQIRRHDLSSLRVVFCAGSQLRAAVASGPPSCSATSSTTSTARPRRQWPRWPRLPTCAPRRPPSEGLRWDRA
jgi:acyl-CoA synthetase (AMP-forming)/AMP-acid ligase II